MVKIMTNFQLALDFTLPHEGSTNFHVEDRGGLTKFGISSKQYPDLDIRNLTLEQAIDIYRADYWLATTCQEFDKPLAVVMFDSAVNCGVHSAKIWLQKAVGVTVDGIIGPKTIYAVCKHNSYEAAGKVIAYRLQRYTKLVARRPEQRKFILGWMNRASDLLLYI